MNNNNIFSGKFGLEKENMRINLKGEISTIPHNSIFGENNPYIIRDFSESQIEMITKPHNSIIEAYNELHNINHVVISTLEEELLWPQSNPPIIISEDEIRIANYEAANKKEYREYLSNKYGKKRSVISGIHFNISFSDNYLQTSFKKTNYKSLNDYKNDLYLKTTKYLLKDKWIFTKLFSASPIFHNSYNTKCVLNSKQTSNGDCLNDNLISLRNSSCGYKNFSPVHLNYESIELYEESIKEVIRSGQIISESEVYNPVRIKKDQTGNISYLELRFIDLNPLYFTGVSLDDLKLIHLMFIYYSTLDNIIYNKEEQLISENKNNAINNISYSNTVDQTKLLEDALELFRSMIDYYNSLEYCPYDYKKIIGQSVKRLKDETHSYASIIKQNILKSSYKDYHLDVANNFKSYVNNNPLDLKGLDGLELSTKILITSAIKLGYIYEIVDYKENFISLTNLDGKTEYIKQATKTSLDNYSSVLVMENKALTKTILSNNSINVPKGFIVTSYEDALSLYKDELLPIKLVVKPNNTNFGLGITIFKDNYSELDYKNALKEAFKHDNTILLEEFIEGLEYRFIVVGDEVLGVLHRRAANVLGDGKHTIKELIELKNEHPYRGTNYQTPLELINVDDIVINYLNNQGKNLEYIPKVKERVYLRENSNITTGGDSIDLTDQVHQSYFNKVLEAVKALNVNITGVDVLIKDITKPADESSYSIIELNFNPAIHIHHFPLEGTSRNISDKVIKELFK